MKRWRLLSLLGLLILCTALAPGCVSQTEAGGAADGVSYAGGNTEGVVQAGPEQVIEATRAAMGELGIHVTQIRAGDEQTQLRGRTASNETVRITVAPEGEGASRLWVRVGTLGDQAVSRQIYNRIANRL